MEGDHYEMSTGIGFGTITCCWTTYSTATFAGCRLAARDGAGVKQEKRRHLLVFSSQKSSTKTSKRRLQCASVFELQGVSVTAVALGVGIYTTLSFGAHAREIEKRAAKCFRKRFSYGAELAAESTETHPDPYNHGIHILKHARAARDGRGPAG
ncbi:hypothetical protein EVAR_80906_1 [Eumeta japonica]|uniref:Uncharacterized protein n=1 Tax=Eumeta variegata TaxID=151549 RepID=A0A4C1V0W3_EUMVA|nr:hypothetical protein EVAR_80906_1 [Eumeta japonica]